MIPENLMYTKDHEWVRVEGNNAFVGITNYAQEQLGDIVFVEIETVGETLAIGESFGSIEAVKTVSDLFMPVGAEILEVNPALEGTPEIINSDPYGKGWMVKIAITDAAELSELMDAAAYTELVNG